MKLTFENVLNINVTVDCNYNWFQSMWTCKGHTKKLLLSWTGIVFMSKAEYMYPITKTVRNINNWYHFFQIKHQVLFVLWCNTFCPDTFCPTNFWTNTFRPDTFCPSSKQWIAYSFWALVWIASKIYVEIL